MDLAWNKWRRFQPWEAYKGQFVILEHVSKSSKIESSKYFKIPAKRMQTCERIKQEEFFRIYKNVEKSME